jgi:hypothetical protein
LPSELETGETGQPPIAAHLVCGVYGRDDLQLLATYWHLPIMDIMNQYPAKSRRGKYISLGSTPIVPVFGAYGRG